MSVLGAHFFNAYRQATRPDAARPHGQALSAYFFVFVVHLFSFFSVFFSVFVVHFFFCALFWLLGAYFFRHTFRPFFLVLQAAKRPSAPPEKPGNPHKQRLCEVFIFLKIFLKSSQVFFILFFILCIFLHIIYVQENVSRIRRRLLCFYTFFLYMSSRRLQPCRHCARGCGCLYFCGEKRKERKRKKMARECL